MVDIINNITATTKRESYDTILQNVGNRQLQCLDNLRELKEGTANELAMYMFGKNIFPYFSRNFVQPRLNELVHLKKVEVIDKKLDKITNRKCAVYKVIEN